MTERDRATTNLMMGYIEREVAARSRCSTTCRRPSGPRGYRASRGAATRSSSPGETGTPPEARLSARVERSISDGIGGDYPLTANAIPGDREHLQVHLRLTDGSPLTIDIHPMSTVPLSGWLPVVLVLQLAVLAACCWLAVRLATRPLAARAGRRCARPRPRASG